MSSPVDPTLDSTSDSTSLEKVRVHFDHMAHKRDYWIAKNNYYYNDLKTILQFIIPEGASVLEVGCGTGDLLNSVKPSFGIGIDVSSEMVQIAKSKYPHLEFLALSAERIDELNQRKFEYIIISDTLGYLEDIQKVIEKIKTVCSEDTRVIFTFHNFFWQPILKISEWFNLKMPQERLNWLNHNDLYNILHLAGFDIIRSGQRFLFPKYIPLFSNFCNKYLVQIPFFRNFGIYNYIIARVPPQPPPTTKQYSVSVVIPARNEKGNIENAVLRLPKMGKHTELIFVEGNSTDNTLDEIKRVCEKYNNIYSNTKDKKDEDSRLTLKYFVQDGKGKGDAVRKGFENSTGDILMILDADLTVPPEELPKFYNAISNGIGEFINGSRLVYPIEKESMQTLNILGNKFFSAAFTWLLSQPLKDTLCGTKVIFKKHYLKLVKGRHYFGNFDPFGDFDLIFGAAKLNLKIIEIPIRYRARTYGETNISRFYHGMLLLKMVMFAINKIKFIGTKPIYK